MGEEASLGLKASQGGSGQVIDNISPFEYAQKYGFLFFKKKVYHRVPALKSMWG